MKKRLKSGIALLIISMLGLSVMALATAAAEDLGLHNFYNKETYISGQFFDIDEDTWYGANQQGAVKTAYELGLVIGKGNNRFDPDGNITVAEAIALASRVHNIYMGGDRSFEQSDIWYQTYIEYALNNSIINGSDFSDYSVYASRAEMAYIFANALPLGEFPEINKVSWLPDVNYATMYNNEIFLLYRAGILNGNDSIGTYEPENSITRAQVTAIIARIVLPDGRQQKIINSDENIITSLNSWELFEINSFLYNFDLLPAFDRNDIDWKALIDFICYWAKYDGVDVYPVGPYMYVNKSVVSKLAYEYFGFDIQHQSTELISYENGFYRYTLGNWMACVPVITECYDDGYGVYRVVFDIYDGYRVSTEDALVWKNGNLISQEYEQSKMGNGTATIRKVVSGDHISYNLLLLEQIRNWWALTKSNVYHT